MKMLVLNKNYISGFFCAVSRLFGVGKRVIVLLFCLFILSRVVYARDNNRSATPMPTDTRIKTLFYNQGNEIFQIKFPVNFFSTIELQKGEQVAALVFGDSTPWVVRTLDSKILIKPTEYGVRTNLNIFTDRRTYLLEISSSNGDDDNDDRLTIMLRFFYGEEEGVSIADISPTTAKLAKIALNKRIAANTRTKNSIAEGVVAGVGSINTNYTYAMKGESSEIIPTMVFDNGSKTYFKFRDDEDLPIINAVSDDFREIPLRVRRSGEYVYIDAVERQITLRRNKKLVCLFNESRTNQPSIAYVNDR